MKDTRIAFCLCGAKELWHADWILKNYGPTIIVQCGSGWWATGYKPCAPNLHFELSTWTLYEGTGKGNTPHPEEPPEHKVSCFKRLTKVFEALWQQVPQQDPTTHKMLVFYCKSWTASVLCAPNRIPDVALSHLSSSYLESDHKPHPQ